MCLTSTAPGIQARNLVARTEDDWSEDEKCWFVTHPLVSITVSLSPPLITVRVQSLTLNQVFYL